MFPAFWEEVHLFSLLFLNIILEAHGNVVFRTAFVLFLGAFRQHTDSIAEGPEGHRHMSSTKTWKHVFTQGCPVGILSVAPVHSLENSFHCLNLVALKKQAYYFIGEKKCLSGQVACWQFRAALLLWNLNNFLTSPRQDSSDKVSVIFKK